MSWYNLLKIAYNNPELQNLSNALKLKYPGLILNVWERHDGAIEIAQIVVPKDKRSQGIGSAVIKEIQEFAKVNGKPIVLSPSPESRKKKSLDNFYKNLGFVPNKGRNVDYTLTTPFAKTMYWKPKL